MKTSEFDRQPEERWNDANVSLRRRITVRHFVIAATVVASAHLVHQRTDDALITLLSLPVMQGFLCYWLTEPSDTHKQPGSW
ncbi:hypothetical protein K7640_13685 [Micromonospora sp. PLK6-60]|uniref:hypothetical protein n=1 Tax=Micromonospora sp. PLK6-60 TaxID=2873383 RepID=UPI001CA6D8C6|nr:hypothetical protein [Micromonospora sp. PLK6-60]MBY8872887.1 hypothetical protein [Micromonospora sp. PLK6-60]